MNGLTKTLQLVSKAVTNQTLFYGQRFTSQWIHSSGSITLNVPEGLWIFQVKETWYYRDGLLLGVKYQLRNESRIFEFDFLTLKGMVFGSYNFDLVFGELNGDGLNEYLNQGPIPFIHRALETTKPKIGKLLIPL